MPVLLLASGEPLTDGDGNPLKTGQTVIDDTFGEGIVRGTVPGEGLNVNIDWLGQDTEDKPKSRSVQYLKAKYPSGGGGIASRTHTGADYESGRVYEERGRNDIDAGECRCGT